MKIKLIRSQVVRVPLDEPLAGGPAYFRSHNQFVILRVETDDGIEGIGVSFFGGALSATLKKAVDQLGELMIGEDPLRIDALTHKLRTAAASAGPGGILTLAISAIDMALWDIKGKYFRPIAMAPCSAGCASACRLMRAALWCAPMHPTI